MFTIKFKYILSAKIVRYSSELAALAETEKEADDRKEPETPLIIKYIILNSKRVHTYSMQM